MYSSLYFAMVVISHFYSVGVKHARLTLSAAFADPPRPAARVVLPRSSRSGSFG
jgi:hypothetical protein